MKMKKILCLSLCFVIVLGILSGCGAVKMPTPRRETSYDLSGQFKPAESSAEMVKISENSNFVLYACLKNGTASVLDKRTGVTYYTNPEDRSEDGIASGFNKNALQSAITVVYNTSKSQEMTCGSQMSSVTKSGLYYNKLSDGSIVFLFNFPKEEFSIPVRYAIEEDRFTATVLTEYIEETGTNIIKYIDLLPFFGAGSSKDDGYMMVPDGSGALIYYNNNRLTATTYSKPLYGFDNGTSDKVAGGKASGNFVTQSENQFMPVFGNSRNENGFLAVITEGAARATIKANVAYKYTNYNTVWSQYAYRTMGSVRQSQKDGSELLVNIAEKNLENWSDYQVSYYFLDTGKNSYADMAAIYRDYLVKNQGLTVRVGENENIPLYLDLYGYIEKTKSILGIPADLKISMTTVEDANSILDTLVESNISNVVVKYNFWAKNSFYGKMLTNARVDGKVGSNDEMQKLQQRLENAGGALYLSGEMFNVYKLGNGVSQYDDVLQSVAATAQRQYKFALDSAMTDARYKSWYLLRPSAMSEYFGKFSSAMDKAGYTNWALDSVGTMLYSELSGNGVGRNQVLELIRSEVEKAASASNGLLLQGANDYVASYATHLMNTSARFSGYDLEDVSIPFYQMVFHGYTSYSLGASNLASNPASQTLNCLEYGAYPMFSLVGQNVDELIGSRLDSLYSADASNWMAFVIAQYNQINEALKGVQGSTIVGHEIRNDNIRIVTYSNGTQILINYGESDATVDGTKLPGRGYAVVENGKVVTSAVAVGNR